MRQHHSCCPTATASSPRRWACWSTSPTSASASARGATRCWCSDGVIEKMFIEPEKPGDPFEVSDADTMLALHQPEGEEARPGRDPHARRLRLLRQGEGAAEGARATTTPKCRSTTATARASSARSPAAAPCRRCSSTASTSAAWKSSSAGLRKPPDVRRAIIGDEFLVGKREDKHLGFVIGAPRKARPSPRLGALPWRRTGAAHCGVGAQPCLQRCGVQFRRHRRDAGRPHTPVRCCGRRVYGSSCIRKPSAKSEPASGRNDAAAAAMGEFPEGPEIIPNPVNRIPGFSLGEHHFVPGFRRWPGRWSSGCSTPATAIFSTAIAGAKHRSWSSRRARAS